MPRTRIATLEVKQTGSAFTATGSDLVNGNCFPPGCLVRVFNPDGVNKNVTFYTPEPPDPPADATDLVVSVPPGVYHLGFFGPEWAQKGGTEAGLVAFMAEAGSSFTWCLLRPGFATLEG